MVNKESEVKYYVSDLDPIKQRLENLGAILIHPRIHELNIRYDSNDHRLSTYGHVLRLRNDTKARITYKSESRYESGVHVRDEIELVVDDFDIAQKLLSSIGFQILMIYEKYRTTFNWNETHITLDEMPFGDFIEIEGSEPARILHVNNEIGLDWSVRILESYTTLFEKLKDSQGYKFRDLTFENFYGLEIIPEMLNVKPAEKF